MGIVGNLDLSSWSSQKKLSSASAVNLMIGLKSVVMIPARSSS